MTPAFAAAIIAEVEKQVAPCALTESERLASVHDFINTENARRGLVKRNANIAATSWISTQVEKVSMFWQRRIRSTSQRRYLESDHCEKLQHVRVLFQRCDHNLTFELLSGNMPDLSLAAPAFVRAISSRLEMVDPESVIVSNYDRAVLFSELSMSWPVQSD